MLQNRWLLCVGLTMIAVGCGGDTAATIPADGQVDTALVADTAPDAATTTDTTNAADMAADSSAAGLPAIDAARLKALHDRVDLARMKKDMDFLASDALGGRIPGSHGSQLAREHIQAQMLALGMEPLGHKGGFFHTYAQGPKSGARMLTKDGKIVPHAMTEGTNVVGLLRGSDPVKSKQYIVLTAHYDHLGVTKSGDIYSGAFDDAGGVVVALEVLRAFAADSKKLARSVVLLITDSEESGLLGAES